MTPFPAFYEARKVGQLYVPDAAGAISAGQAANVKPASTDTQRVMLLLVDAQVDFIHEDGALSVPGAVADTRRTIEWLYRNIEQVTTVAASLDSHTPLQIFFPTWWVNAAGEHPAPFTPITVDDVQDGHWQPVFEPEWSRDYVRKLDEQAKKVLMIWPYHTMIGTAGQTITPALYEAIAYHAGVRNTQPEFLYKGYIARTEHYSILEPEVKVPDEPLGTMNAAFMDLLATHDRVYIAGQAKSHCVLETLTSIVRYFEANNPAAIHKLHLLADCTSSVQHPEINFDALADTALANLATKGLQQVESTDPLR